MGWKVLTMTEMALLMMCMDIMSKQITETSRTQMGMEPMWREYLACRQNRDQVLVMGRV